MLCYVPCKLNGCSNPRNENKMKKLMFRLSSSQLQENLSSKGHLSMSADIFFFFFFVALTGRVLPAFSG